MELSNQVQILIKKELINFNGGMPPINLIWIWKWLKINSEESVITFEEEEEGFQFGGGSFGGGGSGGSW